MGTQKEQESPLNASRCAEATPALPCSLLHRYSGGEGLGMRGDDMAIVHLSMADGWFLSGISSNL